MPIHGKAQKENSKRPRFLHKNSKRKDNPFSKGI